MPAGAAPARWPSACCAPASSMPRASRSTSPTARRPGRASDGAGSSPIFSVTASSWSTPPATVSARPGRPGSGRRVVQPATPGAGPGPNDQDQRARAGRAALDQAPRRVGRHLRGRDDLPVLADSGAALDGQQPLRGGKGPATCGGRRRFANHRRKRPNLIGVAACRPTRIGLNGTHPRAPPKPSLIYSASSPTGMTSWGRGQYALSSGSVPALCGWLAEKCGGGLRPVMPWRAAVCRSVRRRIVRGEAVAFPPPAARVPPAAALPLASPGHGAGRPPPGSVPRWVLSTSGASQSDGPGGPVGRPPDGGLVTFRLLLFFFPTGMTSWFCQYTLSSGLFSAFFGWLVEESIGLRHGFALLCGLFPVPFCGGFRREALAFHLHALSRSSSSFFFGLLLTSWAWFWLDPSVDSSLVNPFLGLFEDGQGLNEEVDAAWAARSSMMLASLRAAT